MSRSQIVYSWLYITSTETFVKWYIGGTTNKFFLKIFTSLQTILSKCHDNPITSYSNFNIYFLFETLNGWMYQKTRSDSWLTICVIDENWTNERYRWFSHNLENKTQLGDRMDLNFKATKKW